MISASERCELQRAHIKDLDMAYVDTVHGAPILFLYDNPTSSYIWQNVTPPFESA
jgi:hypothetical protein